MIPRHLRRLAGETAARPLPAPPAEPTAAAPPAVAPACRHLGRHLHTVHCPPCKRRPGQTADVPVFACGLHRECTLIKTGTPLRGCNVCPDYQAGGERRAEGGETEEPVLSGPPRSALRSPPAVSASPPSALRAPLSWACGVLTAPRAAPTLDRTLASLAAAGFTPSVFAEPGAEVPPHAACERNEMRLGNWRNWRHAARVLLASGASHILICEDDYVAAPALRAELETPWDAAIGCRTGYTASVYHQHAGGRHKIACHNFRGACCLAFPRDVLQQVVEHPIAARWRGATPAANPADVKDADVAVGKILQALKLGIEGWSPSLGQHVGQTSTLYPGARAVGHRAAKTWRAESGKGGGRRAERGETEAAGAPAAVLSGAPPSALRSPPAVSGSPPSALRAPLFARNGRDCLIVLQPRRIAAAVESIARLPVDQLWLTAFAEIDVAPKLNQFVRETDYENYWLVADDVIVSAAAFDAVRELLGRHEAATGYCRLAVGDERVNLTRRPVTATGGRISWSSYDFFRFDEVQRTEGEFTSWFGGWALTGLRRRLWLDYPFRVNPGTKCQSDAETAIRLAAAGLAFVSHRDAYVEHLKRDRNRSLDDAWLVGVEPPSARWEQRL